MVNALCEDIPDDVQPVAGMGNPLLPGGEGGERSEPGEVGSWCQARVTGSSLHPHLTPALSSREEREKSLVQKSIRRDLRMF